MYNCKMLFDIKGVNGVADYRIPLEDGRLVLVGENGSGKTTVCRIIQLFLSSNWYYLAKHSFSSVRLTVEGSRATDREVFEFDLDKLREHFA